MRVALCQINPTVGDLAGNSRRIVNAATQAVEAGAQLAVFPELALCGYPPRDLLDRQRFVEATHARLHALAPEMPGDLACFVGFVQHQEGARGMRMYNAAALLRHGTVHRVFQKQLLPTYDVFDEARYFQEGDVPAVVDVDGVKVGVTICEDLWNDVASPLSVAYGRNPVATCVEAGADLLVNLSASPFTLAKRGSRAKMMAQVAAKHRRPLLFVNQVGGNDDLIFDGASTLFGEDGGIRARARSFVEDLVVADLQAGGTVHSIAGDDEEAALEALTLGVRDYARKCGFQQAIIGLSGGIDSALTACVAARALGPQNVLTLAMPTRYSSQGSLEDAEALAKALGVEFRVIEIDRIFQSYCDALATPLDALQKAQPKDTTYENLQARIRGATLMAISNRTGRLLLSTGNKSELAVGYCTLYGDMAGGLSVISDLPKLFVYKVSRAFNTLQGRDVISERVLSKPPSAELAPDQKDEDSLPPYAQLDPIIERYVEDGMSRADLIEEGFDAEIVNRVVSMIWANEYKRRQMPPGLIITHKAFGPGRRYPIAQRYRD